ncbi:MAG: general stress protein [Chloroflexi bacterium]|nr:general stress protein [Chloroflexota bacterium]
MEGQQMSMGNMVACGVFPDTRVAGKAVADLLNAGFTVEDIKVATKVPEEAIKLAAEKGVKPVATEAMTPSTVPAEKAAAYRERVEDGAVLVTVDCGTKCDAAIDILDKDGSEMSVCVPQAEEGVPPRIYHAPDRYYPMEHLRQPGEPPEKPGEYHGEFEREDQQ